MAEETDKKVNEEDQGNVSSNLMNHDTDVPEAEEKETNTQKQGKHDTSLGYRYSCLLAHYPLPVFFVILGVTVLCGVIAVGLYDLPDFSNPIKVLLCYMYIDVHRLAELGVLAMVMHQGFEARGTEISRRMFSHQNLNFPGEGGFRPLERPGKNDILRDSEQRVRDPTAVNPMAGQPKDSSYNLYNSITINGSVYSVPASEQPELILLPGNGVESANSPEFCHLFPMIMSARMVFVPKKTKTLFTADAMKSMCNVDNELVRQYPSFPKACCKNDLLPSNNDSANNDVTKCTLSLSLGNVVAKLNKRESCDKIEKEDVENTGQLLKDCVSYYEDGLLTELCDTRECQELPLKCTKDNLVFKIFHYLTPSSFSEQVKQGTFNLPSTILFLPIEMLYSYDELWDLYRDVFENEVITDGNTKVAALEFGIKYDLFASYLQADTLYLGLSALVVVIIVMLYVKSPFITAMTLLNMIMSLVLAYFAYKTLFQLSFFPFVNIAAAVLVFGIGADDTFVFIDLWKKARRDIAQGNPHYDRAAVVHETLKHASVTMFVTSFTTGSALYASAISSITAVKCFAIFAGTAIVANFIFTVTWLPVVAILNDLCSTMLCGTESNTDQESEKEPNPLTTWCKSFCRFLKKTFTDDLKAVIFKLRIIWIVIFLGLAIGGFCVVFVSPKLQLPSQSDFQVFRASHQFEKYTSGFKLEYHFEDDKVSLLPYVAVWGLQALDNGNHWDPDSTGKVKFDEEFDLSTPDSQEWLYNYCHQLRNQSFIREEDQLYCFIENLRTTLESPCAIGQTLPPPCCGRQDFPFPSDVFHNCSTLMCNTTDCQRNFGRFRFGPWFEADRIVALSVVATSTYKLSLDYNLMDDYWINANTWTEDQMQDAPAEISGGWFISHSLMQLQFYDLQGSLATGAPAAMGISLGIAAAVLLLTTRNILISLYAIVSISGAVFVTIASLVLLGWQLNIFESAILSLAVGLSVDFTIHYGVGYRLASYKDKKRRTEFSIETLAPAITIAAISTFAAGAMMMPATVVTYVQLGTFLMLVMTISWCYATFFFLALCRTIGPHGNIAQIPLPKWMKCNGSSGGDTQGSHEHVANGDAAMNLEQKERLNTNEDQCNAYNHVNENGDDTQMATGITTV